MSKEKKCNCQIGEINGYEPYPININDYVDKITTECNSSNDVRAFFNENGNRKNKKTLLRPIDYLDKRKGHSTLFNFCPWCGSKLDYKQLRKPFKNE